MAEKKKAYRYFTFLLYPDEFPGSLIKDLAALGVMMISPLHTPYVETHPPDEKSFSSALKATGFSLVEIGFIDEGLKDHFHVLCKSANKITENSFVSNLCELLHNDLRGIAVNPKNCGVEAPELMLRYFYHLDHPSKQHFKFDLIDLDVPLAFFKECRAAFQIEIDLWIMAEFDHSTSLNSLRNATTGSPFLSWVFWNSKNTYLISQLYKEQREVERSQQYV